MKVRQIQRKGKIIGYSFLCFGCGCDHVIYTDIDAIGIKWWFNNNLAKPTFSPSVLLRTGSLADPKHIDEVPPTCCHFFIKNGCIEYLTDCTHYLKGQTIELLEIFL